MAVSLIAFNLTANHRPATRSTTLPTYPFKPKTRISRFHFSASADKEGGPVDADPAKPESAKRASLTARERLRAARVLSRYNDTRPPRNTGIGSSLLESLRETDKGKKRPGLPEAPTDMLDDSKRGLSKGGWTIEIPGGMDAFLIVFSFVFISTVMFATTYIVWKAGAIHFNEY